MHTVPPLKTGQGNSGSPVNEPARYWILAWRTAAALSTGSVLELPIEAENEAENEAESAAENEAAPAADEPNEFVFVGTVKNQGALLDVLNALVDHGLVIQSVHRLGPDDVLEPLCA